MTLLSKTLFLGLLCTLFLLSVFECSTSSLTGGSGTEVSAVFGCVLSSDGKPVEKALVRLRPTSFINDSTKSEHYVSTHSILDTLTGSDGSFSFTKLIPDNYMIEVLYNDTLGSVEQVFIEDSTFRDTLPVMTIAPLSRLSGCVNLPYDTSAQIIIQTYGIDRFANVNSKGNFSITVPCGSHKFHIAAYHKDDSLRFPEYDGIDISINLFPGEQRDAGSFFLRQPPPLPCKDGYCDSIVTRYILDLSGNISTHTSSVIKTNPEGRIVELNLHGLNFSKGIIPDIIKLSELQILDISSTSLPMMFPDIGALLNLEVVKVDGNKLVLFSSTIGNLTKLRELNLSNNELTELPQSIVNCHSLSVFNISGNRLCALDTTMSAWVDTLAPDWHNNQRCP